MLNFIKAQKMYRMAGMSAAILLLGLTALTVLPIIKQKMDAEATAVPATTILAITTGKETASVDITPASSTGTFAVSDSTNEAAFTVTTNNLTGYSLNLVGSNNDTTGRLINDDDPTYYIDTLSSDVDETTFSTGAASTYNNKWGYKLTINGSASTNYLAAPTATTKTIHTTTTPNTTTDSFTLGVGVRADYSKPAGTYTNTFVLTAVGNPISYQINYLDNTGEGGTTGADVSGLPTAEGSANITASAFTLSNDTPTRTGYSFIGWCYGTVTHVSGGDSTCVGTVYQAGDNFTFTSIPSTGTATANLYAMWESNPTYIQDFTNTMCQTQASSSSVKVMDRRDGEKYDVRYINNNCWMVQNLRYVGDTGSTAQSGSTAGSMIMKAATSNISADTTISVTDLTTSSPVAYNTYDYAKYHDSGNTTNGVWYNYAAASAGTITGFSNSTNATYDICPKGWRLPTNSEQSGIISYASQFSAVTGGFYYNGNVYATGGGTWWYSTSYDTANRYYLYYNGSSLDTNYGNRDYGFYVRCIRNTSSVTITFNGNGATGGSMGNQVINGSGSSNPSGTLNANQFTNGDKTFIGWNTAANGSGTSYADGATYTAPTGGDTAVTLYAQWFDGSTIQDLTNTACQTAASSSSIQAVDVRDGNLYDVRYINNNCWMVQNLRYVGDEGSSSTSMIMKSATSNIASDQTLTIGNLTSGNDYSNARIHVATSDQVPSGATYTATDMGVWYNYAAASAGFVTSNQNASTESTYSVCPAGWRLPTYSEQNAIRSYMSQYFNADSQGNYTAVTGGYYGSGNVGNTGYGFWWSSTPSPSNSNYRYSLYYDGSSLGTSGNNRYNGLYVRCIRST